MEKISKELAEKEFERFGQMMDLDFDTSRMDQESLQGFEGHKRRIIDAIIEGRAIVNDAGEIEYTLKKNQETLIFHEPSGATYKVMDKYKESEMIAKSFAFMSAMTEKATAFLYSLPARDIKVLQAITALFLA